MTMVDDEKDPPEDQDDQTAADATDDDDHGDDQNDDADDQSDQDPGDEDPEPQRQQARGSDRIRNQARLNREDREARAAAEARANDAERRAAAAEAAASARTQAAADAEERAVMDAMSDGERTTYLLAKQVKQLNGGLADMRLQTQHDNDRADFRALLAANPRFEKYRDKVEDMVRQVRQSGGFLAREVILDTLIGRDVRTNKNTDKQRKDAKDRVDAARGNTRTQRSDTRGNPKRGTHRERMEREDPLI